ncbi:hypothetical protein NE237_005994 [Protea cynaroides]|uniref:Uncharacterized protein n=1 Tax=Protea cynaroides TaxID=273540 RepID=A0A9Q0QUR2_9MAGN|nr:hypothetical protein NE237_005994 [Protea cynaroides]
MAEEPNRDCIDNRALSTHSCKTKNFLLSIPHCGTRNALGLSETIFEEHIVGDLREKEKRKGDDDDGKSTTMEDMKMKEAALKILKRSLPSSSQLVVFDLDYKPNMVQ